MIARSEDPVLHSARREALLAFAIWLTACVYSVGYCYHYGYDRKVETLTFVWGIPDWVFWGIFFPWTLCTVASFLLSYFVIRDEDLGEEREEAHV